MGRQAYLSRLALGRSAFEAPLKDENGDFIIGARARANDDKSHQQEWDDRGHPQNKKSEDTAKNYRMSQNQILEACGVLVKRDAFEKVKKENAKRVSETALAMSENQSGMILKASDRILGLVLTWWSTSLRRRLMTFGPIDDSLMSVIRGSVRGHAISFFFAGLAFHVPALILRYVRCFIADPDPFELVDHLQFEEDIPPQTFATKLKAFLNSIGLVILEIPLDAASILDSLGYHLTTTIPAILQHHPLSLKSIWTSQDHWLPLLIYINSRDYVACQFGWRLFSVFEQCFTQPRYPSLASIGAAEGDELVDRSSIPGIGRSSSTQTQRRFLGPVNFWTAISTAFSPAWTQRIRTSDQELMNLKFYILRSIAEHELESGDQKEFDNGRALVQVRIASIVRLLEEAQIQVEHDKFIDFDKWADEVDDHIAILRERANLDRVQLERIEDDDTLERSRPREIESDTQREESPSSNSAIAGTEARSEFMGQRQERQAGAMVLSSGRASTPQPGIQRAVSLVDPTLGNGHLTPRGSLVVGDYTMQDIVRQCYRRCRIHGPPQKGRGVEHRVTRLSLFAASSLAWHASSIITNVVLLPFDSGICRLITHSFSQLLGTTSSLGLDLSPALGVGEWFGGSHASWWERWKYVGMLTLTFGLESLVRLGIWRIGVGIALHKAKYYRWGSF